MATAHVADERVAVEHANNCILCSQEGVPAYSGLQDYTFGASGSWDYLECRQCGLLWLSPRPVAVDMGKFYTTYLTHEPKKDHAAVRRLYGELKLALWAIALGRPDLAPNWFWCQIARILCVDPFFAELGSAGTMYLGGINPGKVLDVGCGNGSFLALMRSAGWEVAGLETDPKAAKIASELLGVPITVGPLCQSDYPPGSFDAVTLHHVIEHIYDPIGMIAECGRILKPNGLLVIVTPNLASLGHERFAADWRGLEPPRHLHLFTRETLNACACNAGIRVRFSRTCARMAPTIWVESRAISKRRNGNAEGGASTAAGGLAFLLWERVMQIGHKDAGEEIVLIGTPA